MAQFTILLIVTALVLVTSFMVAITRNTIHAALWMVASCFLLAVVFLFLGLQFIAALQVIIYAGAVMMFIIFAIMMLNLRSDQGQVLLRKTKTLGLFFAIFLFPALLVLSGLGAAVSSLKGGISAEHLQQYGEVATLANFIFSDYLLPFELVSVLLTAGVIGALALAKKRKE